jgi:hypothetical protein
MRIFKRLLFVVLLLVIGALVLSGVAWHYLRGVPSYYRTFKWNQQERTALNQSAVAKFTRTRNQAAAAWSAEVQSSQAGATRPATTTRPNEPLDISLTEEEINAFLDHNFQETFAQWVKNPGIYLQDGQIILAGEVKELGYVASFHFEPKIDKEGRLDLRLVKAVGGRLPLPRWMLESKMQKVRDGLKEKMPAWQRDATMDRYGASDKNLVKAAMGKMLLNVMNDKPSEPLLFLPGENKRALPVRIKTIKIEKQTIEMSLRPLTPEERKAAMEKVKAPIAELSAKDARSEAEKPKKVESAAVDLKE